MSTMTSVDSPRMVVVMGRILLGDVAPSVAFEGAGDHGGGDGKHLRKGSDAAATHSVKSSADGPVRGREYQRPADLAEVGFVPGLVELYRRVVVVGPEEVRRRMQPRADGGDDGW